MTMIVKNSTDLTSLPRLAVQLQTRATVLRAVADELRLLPALTLNSIPYYDQQAADLIGWEVARRMIETGCDAKDLD